MAHPSFFSGTSNTGFEDKTACERCRFATDGMVADRSYLRDMRDDNPPPPYLQAPSTSASCPIIGQNIATECQLREARAQSMTGEYSASSCDCAKIEEGERRQQFSFYKAHSESKREKKLRSSRKSMWRKAKETLRRRKRSCGAKFSSKVEELKQKWRNSEVPRHRLCDRVITCLMIAAIVVILASSVCLV